MIFELRGISALSKWLTELSHLLSVFDGDVFEKVFLLCC